MGAEAKAIGLNGSYTPNVRIFGLNIGYTVGASVGSAHAGAKVAAFYDQILEKQKYLLLDISDSVQGLNIVLVLLILIKSKIKTLKKRINNSIN
mgnify:FL=1